MTVPPHGRRESSPHPAGPGCHRTGVPPDSRGDGAQRPGSGAGKRDARWARPVAGTGSGTGSGPVPRTGGAGPRAGATGDEPAEAPGAGPPPASRQPGGLAAQLDGLAESDAALAGLRQRLDPLLELLGEVERGATLDVWVEFGGGHAVVADVASLYRGLVRDAAGPGLGLEGEAGQLVLLLHHIQQVRREHATGGVRVLLATGESLWFRAVRPGHSGLSRPARPAPAGQGTGKPDVPPGAGSS